MSVAALKALIEFAPNVSYPYPPSREALEAYFALSDSEKYLSQDMLEEHAAYFIHARNSYCGVWCKDTGAFILLREKFGKRFLFPEYHYDRGAPFGTAKPFLKVAGPIARECRREFLESVLSDDYFAQFLAQTRAFY